MSTIVRSASTHVSPTTSNRFDKSRVMPTYWLPCPGNICTSFASEGRGGSSVMNTICLERKFHFDLSDIFDSSKSKRFSNCAQFVATIPHLTPSGLKPWERAAKATESLRPFGDSSKVGEDGARRAVFTILISSARDTKSGALSNNKPPSIAFNSLCVIEGVALWSSTLGADGGSTSS